VFAIKLTRGLPPEAPRAHPLLASPVGEWPVEALKPPDVLELCKNVEAADRSMPRAICARASAWSINARRSWGGAQQTRRDVTALLAKPRRTNHAALSYEICPHSSRGSMSRISTPRRASGSEGLIATWLRSTELRLGPVGVAQWLTREHAIPSSAMKNVTKGSGDQIVSSLRLRDAMT